MTTCALNRPARPLLAVALVLGLAAGIRLVVLEASQPQRLYGDEYPYVGTANSIARGTGHAYPFAENLLRAAWPPGQAFFLSIFIDPELAPRGPAQIENLARAEFALGVTLVALTVLLGKLLFSGRVALASGVLAAIFPSFVAFSTYFWSELLFSVLLNAGLALWLLADRRASRSLSLAAGVVLGVATLTREVALPIAGALAAYAVWRDRRDPAARRAALLRGGVVLGAALLTVLPWTVRNYRVLGGFVPVSTSGWQGMLEGNTFDGRSWQRPNYRLLREVRRSANLVEGELTRMRYLRAEAIARVRAEQPLWLGKKLARNVPLLYAPDDALLVKLRVNQYPAASQTLVRALLVVSVASYLGVVTLGVLGIAGAPNRTGRALALVPVGVVTVLHVVANANPRYRFPLMPLLLVYACHAWLEWAEVRSRLKPVALGCATAVLLVLYGWCLPHFSSDAERIWHRGAVPAPTEETIK